MPIWLIAVLAVVGFGMLLWFTAFLLSLCFGHKVFKDMREDFKEWDL